MVYAFVLAVSTFSKHSRMPTFFFFFTDLEEHALSRIRGKN